MPFHNHKKGEATGLTAYVLFGILLSFGALLKFILTSTKLIPTGDLVQECILYLTFTGGFVLMYYVITRNLINQGAKKQFSSYS